MKSFFFRLIPILLSAIILIAAVSSCAEKKIPDSSSGSGTAITDQGTPSSDGSSEGNVNPGDGSTDNGGTQNGGGTQDNSDTPSDNNQGDDGKLHVGDDNDDTDWGDFFSAD